MEKIVLIIGSGRSGRGMLGQLYHQAGYKLIFADNDPALVDGLRKTCSYSVEMTNLKNGTKTEYTVSDYSVLDTVRDREEYISALAHSRWVSTALMPEAFEQVMEDVAEAGRYRLDMHISDEQFITLGANFVGMEESCEERLRCCLGEPAWTEYRKSSHLVMSIVNRKNLLPAKRRQKDPYRVEGDDKPVLRVEDIPELRAAEDIPPFFRLEHDLSSAMAVKIWSGNLVQCAMAFVAIQKGITGTYEASLEPMASRYAFYAAREGYNAIAAEYSLPPRSPQDEADPVCIFRNSAFNDSLARLVRDPIRKLGRRERFIGPALCCIKHGIVPYYITKCCAYAFSYLDDNDSQSMEIHSYIANHGIEQAVQHFCQLDTAKQHDSIVWQMICAAYLDITEAMPLKEEK